MEVLSAPASDKFAELQKMPWQILLLVKWVLQDDVASDKTGQDIDGSHFHRLRERLYDFPERVDLGLRSSLPAKLFMRQLLHQQIGFQRRYTLGVAREAALLARQAQSHPLRVLFQQKVGIDVLQFLDLSFGLYSAVMDGQRSFRSDWFDPLVGAYGVTTLNRFVIGVSREYPELVTFFRNLPDSKRRFASEFYEFPIIKRYPFLRTGRVLECWHPAVCFRGLEGLVHSVLSEAGQGYIGSFSKIFERHVVEVAKGLPAPSFDESALQQFMPAERRVPDCLLSFPECNIFIESKAGLFDESVMVVGHSEIFAQKTRALRSAVEQGRSASLGLRAEKRAPSEVLNAETDYLLVITNKELSAGRGTALASMYPAGMLDNGTDDASRLLPLQNVYVLSIEDYERLMEAAMAGLNLPQFLEACVLRDSRPETAMFYFEQHLDAMRVAYGVAKPVREAVDAVRARLGSALGSVP